MSLLFFDLESSDLLKRDRPLTDPAQPWAVSIAAALMTPKGKILDAFRFRVRADGRTIRPKAEEVHGISTRAAAGSGLPEAVALGALLGLANQARKAISFGVDFDRGVIESLLLRRGKPTTNWMRPGLEFVDLIRAAAPFCGLPEEKHESQGYRWPNLDEASKILLGEPAREGVHDDWDDMKRAARLYFFLEERGAFTGEEL